MSGFSEVVPGLPGILHWSAFHERIQQPAHSALLPELGVAIDPMPADGIAAEIEARGGLERVLLTNRHHLRGAAALAERFGCPILAPASGMAEFEGEDADIRPYEWGAEVAPGVVAHEVGVLCPDDGVLHIAIGRGALAFADSVISWEGRLAFVPDFLMDEPERVKTGTLAALEGLLGLDFDAILLAHGEPIPSGGKAALEAFIAEPYQAEFTV